MNGTTQEKEFNHGCVLDTSLKPLYPVGYITQSQGLRFYPPVCYQTHLRSVKMVVYDSLGKESDLQPCEELTKSIGIKWQLHYQRWKGL